MSSQPGWDVRCAYSHPRVRKWAQRHEPQAAASKWCSVLETQDSGLSCPAPALPSPQPLFSSGSQRPFQMPLQLDQPLPQRMAQALPTLALWDSFPTLPPSLGPGAGLGSPASLLLPGGDSWGAHGLPIPGWRAPGVARRGVWLCWCSLELLPPSFLLEAEGLEADGWPSLRTGLQVPSELSSAALLCQVPQWGFLCNHL